jgi:hypothetical protein
MCHGRGRPELRQKRPEMADYTTMVKFFAICELPV